MADGAELAPDFTAGQRTEAEDLFGADHIIHSRVVSDSPDRRTRFHEVNLELIRVCDVAICVVGHDVYLEDRVGTQDFLREAQSRKRPLLELQVTVGVDLKPCYAVAWRNVQADGEMRIPFALPKIPNELEELKPKTPVPAELTAYCDELKAFASDTSKGTRKWFKIAALIIIGTHLLATLLAVFAVELHESLTLVVILTVELLLLGAGYLMHQRLHLNNSVGVWAMARLVAEIARSGARMKHVPGYLGHLFTLPLPGTLRPLLRTLNVLHLEQTRGLKGDSWEQRREDYIKERLTAPKDGQIPYYHEKRCKADFWQKVAKWTFLIGSVAAFTATLLKLAVVLSLLGGAVEDHQMAAAVKSLMGMLAIVMPVMAVAGLSLAASFDLEARVHTYHEMHKFLTEQHEQLKVATTERAFHRLALETEERLLGETAGWYSRRAFTGVN